MSNVSHIKDVFKKHASKGVSLLAGVALGLIAHKTNMGVVEMSDVAKIGGASLTWAWLLSSSDASLREHAEIGASSGVATFLAKSLAL